MMMKLWIWDEGLTCIQSSKDADISSPQKTKMPSEKPKYKKVGGEAAEDQKQIRTSTLSIKHPGLVHTKFYRRHWLIQSFI